MKHWIFKGVVCGLAVVGLTASAAASGTLARIEIDHVAGGKSHWRCDLTGTSGAGTRHWSCVEIAPPTTLDRLCDELIVSGVDNKMLCDDNSGLTTQWNCTELPSNKLLCDEFDL